jgi:hypothetical protein
MFLLKRIAMAAVMSCLSEGAIAQGAAAPGPASPSKPASPQAAETLERGAAPVAPTSAAPAR